MKEDRCKPNEQQHDCGAENPAESLQPADRTRSGNMMEQAANRSCTKQGKTEQERMIGEEPGTGHAGKRERHEQRVCTDDG